MGIDRVINILMNRDGCDYDEALARINEAKRLMEQCDYQSYLCEDILMEELGLEMDYIFDIL